MNDSFQLNIEVSQLILAGLHDEAKEIAKKLPLEHIENHRKSIKELLKHRRMSPAQRNTLKVKQELFKEIINENYGKQNASNN